MPGPGPSSHTREWLSRHTVPRGTREMRYQTTKLGTRPRSFRWAISAALAVVVTLLSLGSFTNTQASEDPAPSAVGPAPSAVGPAPSAEATAALTWLSSQLAANNNALPGLLLAQLPHDQIGASARTPFLHLSQPAEELIRQLRQPRISCCHI